MGILGRPTPLEEAERVALAMVERLTQSGEVANAIVAGSIRRRKEMVSDVDIMVVLRRHGHMQVLEPEMPEIHWTEYTGTTELDGVRVELYRSPPNAEGATLQFLTGPGDFNVCLRRKAMRRNWKLSQYGLKALDGERIDRPTGDAYEDELQIFDLLDVPRLGAEERSEWRRCIGW